MSEMVVSQGQALLKSMSDLRATVAEEALGDVAGPVELHEALVKVRGVTDKMEQALVFAMLLEREADRLHDLAKAALEDAELSAADKVRKNKADYATGKETQVDFMLYTLNERKALREAVEGLKQAQTVTSVIRLLHKGVDSTRYDLRERLKAMSLASSLERG